MAGKKTGKAKVSAMAALRSKKKWGPGKISAVAVLFAAATWWGWSYWAYGGTEERFLALAASGAERLGAVERQRASTEGHLEPGQSAGYRDRMPTAGAHDPKWIDPGVYQTPQSATRLVHSLEHGMIVVYYDAPPPDVLATLQSWAGLYGGPWSGLVIAPMPGLGGEVVLTAWERMLRLRPFDPATAAAFIDRFRGRGPEHPVR